MFDSFLQLFFRFILYSFIGYIVEVTNCSLKARKLTLNRGFFLGPYLPIYGISCILMGSIILRYKSDLLILFVMSAFICTTVEYITSYLLELIFKARWWDYNDHRFNIEGRVCLSNSTLFGIGGIFFAYIIEPFTTHIISILPILLFRIISLLLLLIFVIDIIITITTLCQVKISSLKFKNKDVTAEITKIIKDELKRKHDVKTNVFIRHMLNAFPQINVLDYNNPLSKLKRYNSKKRKK